MPIPNHPCEPPLYPCCLTLFFISSPKKEDEILHRLLTELLFISYRNPYEEEIRNAKYPLSTYSISPPISYQPFESTTATFVNTMEGVNAMLSELKSAKEIAVDLEH